MHQHSSIVLVGTKDHGDALQAYAASLGARLWVATETREALAFYVTYFPDILVIEDVQGSTLADETYFHLRAVGAKPLIILAEASRLALWTERAMPTTLVLPRELSDAALLQAVGRLTAEVRSAFRSGGAASRLEPLSTRD